MAFSGSGDGSSGSPYLIQNQGHLAEITAEMGAGVYWRMTTDIGLEGAWTPLCSSDVPFLGQLQGNNKAITGLSVDVYADYKGLFTVISGSVLDLTVSGSVAGRDICGILAGLINNGQISNVKIPALTITGRQVLGGLTGSCWNSGSTIDNCSVGTITTSAGTITATGGGGVGGFMGSSQQTPTVSGCIANVAVSAPDGNNAAGFIGYNTMVISKCAAYGNAHGYGFVGGFSGYNYSTGTCTDCFARGNVSRPTSGANDYIGGFIGWNRVAVTRCYSKGTVTAPGDQTNVGGFAGYSGGGGDTNNFWDTQASGMATSNGGTGKTTAEMQTQATFTNYDFATPVWWISGAMYPQLLVLQAIPSSSFNVLFFGTGL